MTGLTTILYEKWAKTTSREEKSASKCQCIKNLQIRLARTRCSSWENFPHTSRKVGLYYWNREFYGAWGFV